MPPNGGASGRPCHVRIHEACQRPWSHEGLCGEVRTLQGVSLSTKAHHSVQSALHECSHHCPGFTNQGRGSGGMKRAILGRLPTATITMMGPLYWAPSVRRSNRLFSFRSALRPPCCHGQATHSCRPVTFGRPCSTNVFQPTSSRRTHNPLFPRPLAGPHIPQPWGSKPKLPQGPF